MPSSLMLTSLVAGVASSGALAARAGGKGSEDLAGVAADCVANASSDRAKST
jgi:hypothetical protein